MVAGLLALQLAGSITAAVLLQPDTVAVAAGPELAQARPLPPSDASQDGARTQAVEALLAARSRAVLASDRRAFLATVDPQATAFRAEQARLFDALADVPLGHWSYVLHPDDAQPADPALDARYGRWWAPRTTLRHGLRGIDADPAESTQHPTFVRRGERWYLAGDDDFAARGDAPDRFLWDGGKVVTVRGRYSTVLGHPASLPEMRRLAQDVDAAVPRVTAVWGTGWSQRVAVLVPATQKELATLVHARGALTPIAALAVAGPIRSGTARGGDRILVNPPNIAQLGQLGRRVVLTHEVTHVASRAATGRLVPAWLAEGLADHVGFLDSGIPRTVAAEELRNDVRDGRVPAQLPRDRDFDGDNRALAQAYEGAWLAVEHLVEEYGLARVLRFYRALGERQTGDPGTVLDELLRSELGTSTRALTAEWQAVLRDTLA